ncbi:cell division protein FtsZ [Patescibacteria group bacterium]|nr:cell division protein FtsZ [Patescibacteria group bacterium]MCG2701734.1 cell division protein FtsZ [Candidatus Parcubacteria bacterium]MBU4210600.1 cell division protein FtsZ [Patescibacteria group bacterium]MBU4264639.1 cell division protein FtsZ [Patescibacteria group bacterium]MBU4390594.1 cell division protein FtsZ [Patescibacteria group bacterium]
MALIKTLAGQFAKIKVLGVGGGGNNAVNYMVSNDTIKGVEFVAINTDSQVLLNSVAPIKIQIGDKLTRGLGAGGDPKIGQKAAEESKEKIKEILTGTDMVFICGGMGGGTCTGAAPVIAQIAKKELGILTIAVITKPFLFEGTRRMTNALEGISQLKDNVDTLVVIPNQKVMEIVNNQATLLEAFKIADSVLNKGTRAISELITIPGLINLDFADIKSVMANAGTALMGVGEAKGEKKAIRAVELAIDSPLVEVDIYGARGILLNITGGPDITMAEIEETAKAITEKAAPDANIIFGATIDPLLKDKIKVTVIATGFDKNKNRIIHQNTVPKPILQASQTTIPTSQTSKTKQTDEDQYNQLTPSATEEINQEEIDKFLKDRDIPQGVDIIDTYDIPSFLRKNK